MYLHGIVHPEVLKFQCNGVYGGFGMIQTGILDAHGASVMD